MFLVFPCNRTGQSPFLGYVHFIRQLKSNPSTVLKAAEADAMALVTSHQQPTALVVALDRLGLPDTAAIRSGLALSLFQAGSISVNQRIHGCGCSRCRSLDRPGTNPAVAAATPSVHNDLDHGGHRCRNRLDPRFCWSSLIPPLQPAQSCRRRWRSQRHWLRPGANSFWLQPFSSGWVSPIPQLESKPKRKAGSRNQVANS